MIVLGANSEISQAFVEQCLSKGEKYPVIFLFSSDIELANRFACHIQVKYRQNSKLIEWDITKGYDPERFKDVESGLLFCATGFLGKGTDDALYDPDHTGKIVDINYAGLIPVINFFANKMEQKGNGAIIALSSVAGERGRQSNFIYGSAKAALTAYLSGLRNYMYSRKVHVMTVIPGYLDTGMTRHLTLNPRLTASPEKTARYIYSAFKRKKNVIYILPVWKWIMTVIKLIPEEFFKRIKW